MQPQGHDRWEWEPGPECDVAGLFASRSWPDLLEDRALDAITGKVLCVCAAMAIAREVLATSGGGRQPAIDAIQLLADWIDDPTDVRFDRIC